MGDDAAVAESVAPAEATSTSTDAEQEAPSLEDLQAELDRWKADARKHEKRARENAAASRELQKLQEQNQTESERLAAEAERRGYSKAKVEMSERLAAASIKTALAGLVEDPTVIVDDLNLARYIDEDGEVDESAVKTLKDKYTALLGNKQPAKVSHGKRSSTPADAKSDDDRAMRDFARNLFDTTD